MERIEQIIVPTKKGIRKEEIGRDPVDQGEQRRVADSSIWETRRLWLASQHRHVLMY